MTNERIFKEFAENIEHISRADDKGFYELLSQIKQFPKPLKIVRKYSQRPLPIERLLSGLAYMSTNNVRTHIIKDIVEVLDKLKMPQFDYEKILGVALKASIITQDKTLEETVLKLIPEKIMCKDDAGRRRYHSGLHFSLFLYYWKKGDREKAEGYIKELAEVTKREFDISETQREFKKGHLQLSEEEQEKICEMLEKYNKMFNLKSEHELCKPKLGCWQLVEYLEKGDMNEVEKYLKTMVQIGGPSSDKYDIDDIKEAFVERLKLSEKEQEEVLEMLKKYKLIEIK